MARSRHCDTCGHSTAAPNDDHGMELVMRGECVGCDVCDQAVQDPNCPCGGVGSQGHRDECPASEAVPA